MKHTKFLIINFCGLGDKILTTPMFREIKKNLPDSYIAFVTEPAYSDVLSNNPYLDELIIFDKNKLDLQAQIKFYLRLRSRQFDVTIDLTKSTRGRIITFLSGAPKRVGFRHKGAELLAYNIWTTRDNSKTIEKNSKYVPEFFLDTLRKLGMSVENSDLEIYPSMQDKAFADEFLKNEDKHSLIGLNPGASAKIKQWSPEKFAQLSTILEQEYKIVIIQGHDDDETVNNIISQMKNKPIIVKGFTLLQLASLISHLSLLITNDTGVKPIAVAMGIPTITFFGPTNYINYTPLSGKHLILRKELSCSPCGKLECDNPKCMDLIQPDEVLNLLKQIV